MTMNELLAELSLLNNVCYSGGAEGADRLFGLWALLNNQMEIHFSFEKHKYHVDQSTILVLPQDMLSSDDVYNKLIKANKSLKRSIPYKGSYVYNLLARNTFQVAVTDRVYCLAKIIAPDQIDGGTAWATQMYIDLCNNPELYVYNLLDNKPYKYDVSTKTYIQVDSVPTPYGKWTGIGSRRATKIDMDSFSTYFRN